MTPRRRLLLIVAVVVVAASTAALFYVVGGGPSSGCTTGPGVGSGGQTQNLLIVASITGFNDSADHGVPANCWPVIHIQKGTLVNITVSNIDKQPHGFSIDHYYDSSVVTVAPGQTIHVSFVANETGNFRIYCSIFCTVHWAMQSGELIVG